MQLSRHDTICAIATPPGHSGIGIVRLSGPAAKDILFRIWEGNITCDVMKSHHCYLGDVVDHATHERIDSAVVTWMQAPHSYTGDEAVELSCHGSPVVLERIVRLCMQGGARLALPGEFTRRAYLNRKMDLSQAEAVCDLIHASSEQAARLAHEQLAGRLSDVVGKLQNQLKDLRAFVEAAIDFPEEDIAMIQHEGIAEKLESIAHNVDTLSGTYSRGRIIREGVRVAIVGSPNVGKSSLLNRLAGTPRALVHDEPGTTRDLVEVAITIDNVVFHLTDTAGLHETNHVVEEMGIQKTREAMGHADMWLVVLDGSRPLLSDEMKLLQQARTRRSLVCTNKIDVPNSEHFEKSVRISALTGEGIDNLFDALKTIGVPSVQSDGSGTIISNLRHYEALQEAQKSIQQAFQAIGEHEGAECIAHHLRIAQDALGRITGLVTDEDVLDSIFSQFCIGK